ncbi:MAG: hypothetical protein ABIG44_07030 [Planctomycetota bacterium]
MVPMERSFGARTAILVSGLLVMLAGLGIGGTAPVLAADRMVFAENFAATW